MSLMDKRNITMEEVSEYLAYKRKVSKLTAFGVILCIGSIIPLLSLQALVGQNYIDMSNKVATTIGIMSLFGLIAVAVGILLKANLVGIDLDKTSRNKLHLDDGSKRILAEDLDKYQPIYIQRVTFSVILIILSTLPLIAVSILIDNGWISLWMVNLMLLLIAFGVYVIVPTSNHYNALKDVMEFGNPISEKSKQLKRTEKVAAFYWPLVIASYLGWSLWTMAWGTTWIMWPVAAVLFAALIGFINLFDSND